MAGGSPLGTLIASRSRDYRLIGFRIDLPPLRARAEDVAVLAEHFLRGTGKRLEPRAVEILQRYSWPGNVRQLRNTLRRAAAVAPGDRIDERHLELGTSDPATLRPVITALAPGVGATLSLQASQRATIEQALALHNGNLRRAAKALGIHRSTLRRRMREFGRLALRTFA